MNAHNNGDLSSNRKENNSVGRPSKLLFWIMVGFFLAAIIGSIVGILIFRNVLRPGQQQRVITILPFMENFLPPQPAPDATIPTPVPVERDISPEDLLNAPGRLPTVEATLPANAVTPSTTSISASPATSTPTLAGGSD